MLNIENPNLNNPNSFTINTSFFKSNLYQILFGYFKHMEAFNTICCKTLAAYCSSSLIWIVKTSNISCIVITVMFLCKMKIKIILLLNFLFYHTCYTIHCFHYNTFVKQIQTSQSGPIPNWQFLCIIHSIL